ncbi:MAG: hypothetical protein JNL81_05340 [Hyphomonadaceae bacterium]|nr:hypothetical protein [Hyphomonadaceae bacterium]
MDFYVNTRILNVRIVQGAIVAAAIGIVLLASGDDAALALILGAIGAACVAAFEIFYIRRYITRITRDGSGWVMSTLSAFGERHVRFDPAQVRFGNEIEQHVRFGDVNYHFPLYVAGRRFVLDTTPPVQFDLQALQRAMRS